MIQSKKVVITTPAWLHGDGVGHDVEGMARTLLDAGHEVYVYSPYHYAPAYEGWRINIEKVRVLLQDPETILIHHHSIRCDQTEDLLRNTRAKVRVMRYHNVTPPGFFAGYDDAWVANCTEGRLATPDVARQCNYHSVPSLYNARDLVHAGVESRTIAYLPYFHKLEDFDKVEPDPGVTRQLERDSRLRVLFLGRRVNNKGHLHLIRTIAAYVARHDSDIILNLVGQEDQALRRYNDEILREIDASGLRNNVELHGKISFAGIVAYYRSSDVFLCMSEHEGFCIPVIEAQHCGLPVIAYYRGGVPEALGPTQEWLTSLNYSEYSDKLWRIRSDKDFASRLSREGRTSVRQRFDIAQIRKGFLTWFDEITGTKTNHMARPKRKIAFVVQRYGKDVAGGAEYFARMFAERLAGKFDITVLTTTSRTLDWDDGIPVNPADALQRDGVPAILRFAPVPRDWADFGRACQQIFEGEISFAEWLTRSGPNTPGMEQYLQDNVDNYDLIVNWTYLYANARYVAQVAGSVPTICVPFFHDERWLYCPGHGALASRFDRFVYQTREEKLLAAHVGGIDDKPSVVMGAGIEEPVADQVRESATSSPVEGSYLLYVGRIERAKGVDRLFNYYMKYKESTGSSLKLVVVGRVHDCEVPSHPDIILPGFISEQDKFCYLKHAAALVNPSHFESFSLVVIESWAELRPVLVDARCPATSGQVRRAGGGFIYSNYRDFAWSLKQLEDNPGLADELGRNGNSYYERNYRWNRILPRMSSFLEAAMNATSGSRVVPMALRASA